MTADFKLFSLKPVWVGSLFFILGVQRGWIRLHLRSGMYVLSLPLEGERVVAPGDC
jgi:hypothetical protein